MRQIDWEHTELGAPEQRSAGAPSRQRVEELVRSLVRGECDWARALMLEGAPLVHRVPGRAGWELRLVVQGGLRILERIRRVNGDVFNHRPKLGPIDWLVLAGRSLRMSPHES